MNSTVKDINGYEYKIEDKLNSGGQGCVFTVEGNDSIVIKAMVNEETLDIIQDDKMYEKYKQMVSNVITIGEFSNLAVPTVMLEKPYCGYIMQFMSGLHPIDKIMLPYVFKNKDTGVIVIPGDYSIKAKKLGDNIIRKIATDKEEFMFSYNVTGGLYKRLRCMANLARILGRFEDNNIAYCDISPNNVFISKDYDSYETWLIDIDNLKYSNDKKPGLGTPTYKAPEIEKGETNTIYSDEYSFAILAFQVLTLSEPFNGKMRDEYSSWDNDDWDVSNENEEDAFDLAVANGEIPWVFEKIDTRNFIEKPLDPRILLTDELYNLFERTFNKEGREKPKQRPSMWEWYDALIDASESLISGELRFEGEKYKLIKRERDTYFKLPITYLGEKDCFLNQNSCKPIKVLVSDVLTLMDENGNKEYIARKPKTIFWKLSNEISSYSMSNYILLGNRNIEYSTNALTFIKQEELFKKTDGYKITSVFSEKNVEIVIVENGLVVKKIDNLLNTIIYIKQYGEIIKKISFERK